MFRASMGSIKTQFFLSYALIGSLMPLLGIFLKAEKGFSDFQVGLAMALTNVAMIASPGLITLLADMRVDSRRILAAAFATSLVVLSGMYVSPDPNLTLLLFLFHGLAFVAMIPLMDGFYFTYAEQVSRLAGAAAPAPPYPKVRVWGTIGFIVPSLILYGLIEGGRSAAIIIPCAVGFALCSIVNSFRLPQVQHRSKEEEHSRLPTAEALALLLSPRARWLCLALGLGYMATAAFYAFFAIYLQEEIGIPASQIGLYLGLGVFLEIFWTLLMPRLQRAIRLKGILIAGLAYLGVRVVLLALLPHPLTALLVMLGHGLEVLALFVVPVMFLNRLATDRFRNSIQGVFTMAVGGVSRVVGGLFGGWVAHKAGLDVMLLVAGGMGLGGMLVVICLFRTIPEAEEDAAAESEPKETLTHA